jgi:hypothetical protein
MNRRMSALLLRAGVPAPFRASLVPGSASVPALAIVGDCVFLKERYEANKHINPKDFPDNTGYECLVNHVHFSFDGTSESLKSSLRYAVALQEHLSHVANGPTFQVIVSVDDHECTIRFHKLRRGENWVADDLESYAEEAILLLQTK